MKNVAQYQPFKVGHIKKQTLYELTGMLFYYCKVYHKILKSCQSFSLPPLIPTELRWDYF